jgi:prepilin-type N-terminal cleavage/methylation domain-containing protein
MTSTFSHARLPGAAVLARGRGFSLIELLIVIALIGVVAGLVLAAVQRVREASRRTECLNRLRQQGLAVLNYESSTGRLPPGAVWGPFEPLGVPAGAGHGMWVFLLPHIEQTPVAKRYRIDLSFDHADNQAAATARLTLLMCPSADPGRIEEWDAPRFGGVADYVPLEVNPFLADLALVDPVTNFGGALPANKLIRLADIKDGTSTTLLLVEAAGRPGVAWSSPLSPVGLRQVFGGRNGFHRGGTTVCLADGSTRFLPDSIDIRMLGRLATRAGGEVIEDW